MPTWATTASFLQDIKKLTTDERKIFGVAVAHFVEDLQTGRFRKGLRVKKMAGRANVWEMTWADNGRATFEYGDPVPGRDGPHVIWRRVGTHKVFKQP